MVIAAVVLFVAHLYVLLDSAYRQQSIAAGPTSPTETETAGVRIRGWAERSKISPPEAFAFWLTVENRSGAPLQRLVLRELRAPGFVPAGACWNRAGLPQCQPADHVAIQPLGLPLNLGPGDVAGLTAELSPSGSELGSVITGVFAWQAPDGAQKLGAVEIGPIQVVEQRVSFGTVMADAGYSFVKDLGLPLVVGFLAYYFQQTHQERARRDEIRRSFLERATDNAVHYLLPLVQAAQSLQSQAEKLRLHRQAAVRDDWRTGLYYMVLFLKRVRDLAFKGGGFMLEDTRGEVVLQLSGNLVFERARDRLGYFEISLAQDLMEGHESVTQFWAQAASRQRSLFGGTGTRQQAIARLEDSFKDWVLTTFAENDDLLSIYSDVLLFEINWLFAPWYESATLKAPDLAIRQNRLADAVAAAPPAARPPLAQLYAAVEAYSQGLKSFSGRGPRHSA
jgi:hypothetical protein